MTARRSHGEGSVFYEESRNRWVGVIDLGLNDAGKRKRTKITARTKSQALKRLRDVQRQAEAGLPVGDGVTTFGAFLDTWLEDVCSRRAPG